MLAAVFYEYLQLVNNLSTHQILRNIVTVKTTIYHTETKHKPQHYLIKMSCRNWEYISEPADTNFSWHTNIAKSLQTAPQKTLKAAT